MCESTLPKIFLYGLIGTRIILPPYLENVSESLKEKAIRMGLDKKKEKKVCRIMTGPNVGHWIPLNHISGDCLTHHLEDIKGRLK